MLQCHIFGRKFVYIQLIPPDISGTVHCIKIRHQPVKILQRRFIYGLNFFSLLKTSHRVHRRLFLSFLHRIFIFFLNGLHEIPIQFHVFSVFFVGIFAFDNPLHSISALRLHRGDIMKLHIFIQGEKSCKKTHCNHCILFFPDSLFHKRKYRNTRLIRFFLYFSNDLILQANCLSRIFRLLLPQPQQKQCPRKDTKTLYFPSACLYAVFQSDYPHRQVYAGRCSFMTTKQVLFFIAQGLCLMLRKW